MAPSPTVIAPVTARLPAVATSNVWSVPKFKRVPVPFALTDVPIVILVASNVTGTPEVKFTPPPILIVPAVPAPPDCNTNPLAIAETFISP